MDRLLHCVVVSWEGGLSLKSRRWMSATDIECKVQSRMVLTCHSYILSTWLFLSQVSSNMSKTLVLIKNKGHGKMGFSF